ncbi:hypothetical protein [Aneurinibacillus tyrosinisolvens]|uniref:hypothetical protein n=1 Tax=Aneurinibacillus tyrosinisolvens TaxID=1443435 RepID=UPI00063ED71A|nr:hypothetical protein [Aneurinibacillus tyrosinisolvens]
MMKYISSNLILFTLFVAGTIITLSIVYNNIDNPFSYKFVIGYVIFLLSYGLYLTCTAVINSIKLNRVEFKKLILRFITLFIFLSIATFICNYFFKPSKIELYDFSPVLGLSLAMSFFELAFFSKKKD